MSSYEDGLDVLGDMGALGGLLSIIPGLGGGGSKDDGNKTQDEIKKAIAAEQQRQALEKAKADAARAKTVTYVVIGSLVVVAVGGAAFVFARRK